MTVRRLTTVVFILLSIALLGVPTARSSGQSPPKSPDGPGAKYITLRLATGFS